MKRLPYFYITGGDPILHSRFWDILALLRERSIPFTILGNPFHLTDAVCTRLKEYGCDKYQLSIDGLRETHDAIRKPGSFDATLDKIDVIRRAGIRCAVMTTVSGTNLHEIPGIIDLVVARRVDIFAFGRYCPTSFEKSTHIEPLEYRDFLERVWHQFEQYRDSGTTFNLKDHLWTLFLYEKGAVQDTREAGRGYHLRRLPLRRLPHDHPADGRGDGLPPFRESGGQSLPQAHLQPLQRPGDGGLPAIRAVREVLPLRATALLPGLPGRCLRLYAQLLRPRPAVLESD